MNYIYMPHWVNPDLADAVKVLADYLEINTLELEEDVFDKAFFWIYSNRSEFIKDFLIEDCGNLPKSMVEEILNKVDHDFFWQELVKSGWVELKAGDEYFYFHL